MSFQLKYEKNGKKKIQKFGSYYECIVRKEKLRKQGVKAEYAEVGLDAPIKAQVPKANYSHLKHNEKFRNFLTMLNGASIFKAKK